MMAVRVYKRTHVLPRMMTPTRATRRSLAQALQRLVDASVTHRLEETEHTRWGHKLAVRGWPSWVYVDICQWCVSVVVVYENCWWDLLHSTDCMPVRCKGGWRSTCGNDTVYRTLDELYWYELMSPLMGFLSRLPSSAQLELCSLKDRSVTWAQMSAVGTPSSEHAYAVIDLSVEV